MSTLSEIREQRRLDRLAEAQIRQAEADRQAVRRREDQAAAAVRRREDQAAAEQRAADRRQERHNDRAARQAALRGLGMSALWATMIVLPIALAWTAQADFALATLHIPGPFNHLFPASVETGAWLCAFEAHVRIRSTPARPVGSLRRWMWVLAVIAAAINAAHGIRDAGVPAGLALGSLSLLGVLLHSIRQSLDAAESAGHSAGRVVLGLWRRIRYLRLSLAAASIRAARELDAATAWRLAWEDRYGVGPDTTRRERRLGRVIVRREMGQDRKAAKDGEITIVAGRVQRDYTSEIREFVDTERRAVLEQAEHAAAQARTVVQEAHDALMAAGMVFGPDALVTAAEPATAVPTQHYELSSRAAEVLPALREAIEDRRVQSNPGVKRIRAWARDELGEPLGVPVAQELRDAVSELRVIEAADDREAS